MMNEFFWVMLGGGMFFFLYFVGGGIAIYLDRKSSQKQRSGDNTT